ncbi:MAG: septum formation protein Maf [Bdellovibrionaceae bacterium]|jgi:septum formation protein|nr:septum formation protein Maf [Pseudobdellovibrionaceae bacterium]
MKLILVSQSPRRKDLLVEMGYHFHTHSVQVSEFIDENLNLERALMNVARQKAQAFLNTCNYLELHKFIVLSADTTVIFRGEILGKPKDEAEAHEFLSKLSGNKHEVRTSVCFYHGQKKQFVEGIDCTKIYFKTLSKEQIREYVSSGDPFDKAGGYGIQNVQSQFVEKIEGSYSNVVGLPMELIERIFKNYGWKIDKRKSKNN